VPRDRAKADVRYAVVSLLLSLSSFGAFLLYAKWHGETVGLRMDGVQSFSLSWELMRSIGSAAPAAAALAVACSLVALWRGPVVWGAAALAASAGVCYVTWAIAF